MYCPNCGKEIEEGVKYCKYCGAKINESELNAKNKGINQLPETITFYNVPKILPKDMLKEGEKIVFESRPHKVYRLLFSWILGGIFLVPMGIGILISLISGLIPEFLVLLFFAIIIAFFVLLIPYFKWRHTVYGVTTDRVIRLRGVISKDIYESPLDRVQDIRLKMSVLQRIFGCGDVMMTTAGTGWVDCIFKDVPKPSEVQKTLMTLIRR